MILWKTGESPILISMRTILIFTSLLVMIQVRPCAAEYGWPPPGYDLRTWCNCQGCHYRRLCEIIHDRRCRCCCQEHPICPVGVEQKRASSTQLLPPAGSQPVVNMHPQPSGPVPTSYGSISR